MNELKKRMISQAKSVYKNIYPCGDKKNLQECFTVMDNRLVFWFNTEDDSTHLITSPSSDELITA